MKDLNGQTIKVGDHIAFAVRSFSGYLGLGVVQEIIPEKENPKRPKGVDPQKIKVKVTSSSKYVGAKKGTVITLGNSADRLYFPKSRMDTVFVYKRAD